MKETINKTKKQPKEWEKVFANDISDKGLVSKIYKELIKLNTQRTNNSIQTKYPIEKRQALQQMVLGKLDSHIQKKETGPFAYTIHKNRLKLDGRPNWETGTHQNPTGEHRQRPL